MLLPFKPQKWYGNNNKILKRAPPSEFIFQSTLDYATQHDNHPYCVFFALYNLHLLHVHFCLGTSKKNLLIDGKSWLSDVLSSSGIITGIIIIIIIKTHPYCLSLLCAHMWKNENEAWPPIKQHLKLHHAAPHQDKT